MMNNQCAAIYSPHNPDRQCTLLTINGDRYCILHQNIKKVIDFQIKKNVFQSLPMQVDKSEMKIKLLILLNNSEYLDEIPELVGPVFNDILLSENNRDPIMEDIFWEFDGQIKIPSKTIIKYFLFSYVEQCNLKCLSIFTVYEYLKRDKRYTPEHTSNINIQGNDLKRARKLIDIYQSEIALFDLVCC
jgi:hypothetical protein